MSPVVSLEPSSTTMISCSMEAAVSASRMAVMVSAMAMASFLAGMITESTSASLPAHHHQGLPQERQQAIEALHQRHQPIEEPDLSIGGARVDAAPEELVGVPPEEPYR